MEQFGYDLLCHTSLIGALFGLCWYLVPKDLQSTFASRLAVADIFFSVPFYVWLSYAAINATLAGYDSVEGRWLVTTWYSYHYVLSYVVKMVAHIPIVLLTESPSQAMLMVVHHGLSLACYSSSIYCDRMQWWGALDGLCEVTTIFMNNLYLLQKLGLKDKLSNVTLVNGFLFWLSYIPFRLVLFPVWLYWFYIDVQTNNVLPWESLTVIEAYLYPATNVVLLVLSSFWFFKITKGFLKLLAPNSNQKQEPKKKV
eukprot:TRINITY_DN16073_c0_g1_i1.p1 TRINITY_DN16073_c0_g1~~TRINITY_DN16073_c0_g1_i1.p1  ORF type:complete len:255 (-),score=12.85 TRINITY_DN16073_c0_g1_i1:80-844(-)